MTDYLPPFADIVAVANDKYLLKALPDTSRPEVWQNTGKHTTLVWGDFCGQKVSYRTSIDLDAKTYACTCKSARYPCNHGVGLWLLQHRATELFSDTALPEWLNVAKSHPAFSTVQFFRQTPSSPIQWKRNAAQRLHYIRIGMADLEAWLLDIIDNGLANAPDKPKGYWMSMSRRLNDSYCPAIAVKIEQLPKTIANQKNWADIVLAELGKLYLLSQSFKHFETLTPETQFDLFTTVGWHNSRLAEETDEAVVDTWVVLDRQLSTIRKRQMVTVVLWGQTTQRFAMLTGIAHSRQKPDMHLMPGVTVTGSLRYYPSELQLQAYPEQLSFETKAHSVAHPLPTDLQAVTTAFQTSILTHPWIAQLPTLLSKVAVNVHQGQIYLQDSQRQALPVNMTSKANWYLQVYSQQAPISVFGYWNGTTFDAVTLNVAGNWIPLKTLPEIIT